MTVREAVAVLVVITQPVHVGPVGIGRQKNPADGAGERILGTAGKIAGRRVKHAPRTGLGRGAERQCDGGSQRGEEWDCLHVGSGGCVLIRATVVSHQLWQHDCRGGGSKRFRGDGEPSHVGLDPGMDNPPMRMDN